MPSWLPSIPYSVPDGGYWDPVTSTLNWCEEDYYLTRYIAEITNSLTNILFMRFAYLGIQNCLRYGHDTIYIIAFSGYLLVGLGSFLFHASLKYPMQLVDELSMIYTTCLMAHATFGHGRSKTFQAFLGTSLVALAVGVSVYYHFLQDPKFHQTAYAILTTVIVVRCIYVMEVTLRPWAKKKQSGLSAGAGAGVGGETGHHQNGHAKKDTAGQRKANVQGQRKEEEEALAKKNLEILYTMWTMVAVGLTTFLAGFGIWHLDNVHCGQLRQWRRDLGMPWGFLLEGHAWWHLMTGTGGYFYIVWGIWLRHCLNGNQMEYDLIWPSIFSLPEVVKLDIKDTRVSSSSQKVKKIS